MARKPTYEELKQRVSELEKAEPEEALRAALAEAGRFRQALDEVSVHVYMKDPQSRYIYANRLTLELFGCSAEELVGRDDTHFFPPDTVKRLQEVDLRVFAGEQTSEEIDVTRAGSERCIYWEVKTPIYAGSEHKTIWGLLGISTDITERKQAEEALTKSERFLNAAGQIAKVGGWEIDGETQRVFWTKEIYNITEVPTDYDPSSLGKEAIVFFSPEDQLILDKAIQRAFEHGEPYNMEFLITTAKGNKKWVQAICEPVVVDGKVVKLGGTFQDITDRKQTDEALETAIQHLTAHIDNSPLAVVEFGPEFRVIRWSKEAEKIFGWAPEEIIGKSISEMRWVYDEDKELVQRESAGLFSGERRRSLNVNRNYRKDGSVIHCEWYNSGIYDTNGKMISILSQVLDITERKKTDESLKESEDRFRQLFEYAPDAYYLNDLEGNFIDGNRAAEDLTGYKRKELIGKNFIETGLMSVEQMPKVIKLLKQNVEGKTTGPDEFTLKRKDGVEVIVEIRNLPTKINNKDIVLGIARDISERKRLEDKLLQTHKMEAIATLAGGIAHEFNNALTSVVGNIQLLEMDFADNKAVTGHTDAMKTSSHRMVNLTSQLLAYARGGRYQAKTMSMSDFVEDTLPIIKSNIDPSIRLETDLPRDIFSVEADPAQMQMVLSAVVSNSTEAIEGDGRIRITCSNKEIDATFVKNHPELTPGNYVCLTVEDDGKGMDEETLSKIFDPFYTTKFMGRGLGMAAVYGIIRNHDGWITVDSELNKGTIVRIYLPAIEAEEIKKEAIVESTTEMPKGEGTILIIEDEEMVMNVIRAVLERLGYRMLEAKTGREAVEIAKTFDGDIDLAILDIKLPDIQGDKVYPLIMEARPNLKVIVCSGYSIDTARGILDAGAQDFIQKPFNVKDLSQKLRKILEKE